MDTDSLNGQAAMTGLPVIANDISHTENFKADELLPLTCSELVMPLKVGDQLLGTLDVHSSLVDGFNEQEVLILQSLGDQVAVAIQNSILYERSKEMAVLEERNRLARELHDSVTQSLFSMDLHARAIATYIEKDLDKARQQVQELRQTTHDTLQEMRGLIYDLRPISLKDIGLSAAIREQIERLEREDCRISLELHGVRRLADAVEAGLFRITQEALRNAVKHSGASNITCALRCEDDQVRLMVKDDGRGFSAENVAAKKQSFGILGMRERTEMLQGRFVIETSPMHGTCITVEIPI